jgi:D-cysteine desulfhydrase
MALGVALCGLQWRITGVMLAGDTRYYEDQAAELATAFQQQYGGNVTAADLPLEWVERPSPRRFGKVLAGEVAACGRIAREHGILLDPIYSLAAWEVAEQLACREGSRSVAMLHAGGSLALFGLAQRFPDQF